MGIAQPQGAGERETLSSQYSAGSRDKEVLVTSTARCINGARRSSACNNNCFQDEFTNATHQHTQAMIKGVTPMRLTTHCFACPISRCSCPLSRCSAFLHAYACSTVYLGLSSPASSGGDAPRVGCFQTSHSRAGFRHPRTSGTPGTRHFRGQDNKL